MTKPGSGRLEFLGAVGPGGHEVREEATAAADRSWNSVHYFAHRPFAEGALLEAVATKARDVGALLDIGPINPRVESGERPRWDAEHAVVPTITINNDAIETAAEIVFRLDDRRTLSVWIRRNDGGPHDDLEGLSWRDHIIRRARLLASRRAAVAVGDDEDTWWHDAVYGRIERSVDNVRRSANRLYGSIMGLEVARDRDQFAAREAIGLALFRLHREVPLIDEVLVNGERATEALASLGVRIAAAREELAAGQQQLDRALQLWRDGLSLAIASHDRRRDAVAAVIGARAAPRLRPG